MLLKLVPYLQDDDFIKAINKYLYSPFHILAVAILLTLGEIFSIEFPIYYLLLVTSFFIPVLISPDMTPLIPFGLMFHLGVSLKTAQFEPTIVMGKNIVHFWIIFPIFSITIIARLIFDIVNNKERRHHYPRFLAGFVALALAYLFGGIGSPYFSFKSMMFGLREFLAIGGVYLYLIYSIDLDRLHKDYFAWIFLAMSLSISTEIVVLVSEGNIANSVETGWGICNDLGGTLAFALGGAAYFAATKRGIYSWVFTALMFYFMTVIGLTGSRGGFFTAGIIIIIYFIIIMMKARMSTVILSGVVLIAWIATFTGLMIAQQEFMHKYFGRVLGDGINYSDINSILSGRYELWKSGIRSWKEFKLFGVGWLHNDWHDFIFQARFHNTYVQLLATSGVFGLACYAFHRLETLIRIFRRPKIEKTFAALIILALLIASTVDCHFFNIYPGFSYAFLLVYIESRDTDYKRPVDNGPKYNVSTVKIYF